MHGGLGFSGSGGSSGRQQQLQEWNGRLVFWAAAATATATALLSFGWFIGCLPSGLAPGPWPKCRQYDKGEFHTTVMQAVQALGPLGKPAQHPKKIKDHSVCGFKEVQMQKEEVPQSPCHLGG